MASCGFNGGGGGAPVDRAVDLNMVPEAISKCWSLCYSFGVTFETTRTKENALRSKQILKSNQLSVLAHAGASIVHY